MLEAEVKGSGSLRVELIKRDDLHECLIHVNAQKLVIGRPLSMFSSMFSVVQCGQVSGELLSLNEVCIFSLEFPLVE